MKEEEIEDEEEDEISGLASRFQDIGDPSYWRNVFHPLPQAMQNLGTIIQGKIPDGPALLLLF